MANTPLQHKCRGNPNDLQTLACVPWGATLTSGNAAFLSLCVKLLLLSTVISLNCCASQLCNEITDGDLQLSFQKEHKRSAKPSEDACRTKQWVLGRRTPKGSSCSELMRCFTSDNLCTVLHQCALEPTAFQQCCCIYKPVSAGVQKHLDTMEENEVTWSLVSPKLGLSAHSCAFISCHEYTHTDTHFTFWIVISQLNLIHSELIDHRICNVLGQTFFFFLVALGFELKVSHLLRRHSRHSRHPTSPQTFFIKELWYKFDTITFECTFEKK
jgi:hypothetical protein